MPIFESAEIVNHFFIEGMDLDRSQNSDLSNFIMVSSGNGLISKYFTKNTLRYLEKSEVKESSSQMFRSESKLQ